MSGFNFNNISNNMDYDYSFYIPRVNSSWCAKDIIDYFHEKNIGGVSRVDFTPTSNNLPTDYNYYFVDNNQMYSAFVHVYELYKNDMTNKIIKSIDELGQYKLDIENSDEFWYLKKNNRPLGIPIHNIPQLSDLIRGLENKVNEQQSQIDLLVQTITNDRYFYNQTSFNTTIHNDQETLYDGYNDFINKTNNISCNDTKSQSSDSTHSSMPSLETVSQKSSNSSRKENSDCLCGNQ
jgi:hypothetical protein